MLICSSCLAIGGHFGGELVYGKGYVFEVFKSADRAEDDPVVSNHTPDPEVVRTVSYASQIQPIFENACWHCHGAEKGKAGLRMHNVALMFADEEDFWVIRPGDPDASLLLERISLPADHMDVMPPDADPLSADDVALIRTWIEEGAYDDSNAADANADADADGGEQVEPASNEQDPAPVAVAPAPVDSDALGLAPIDESARERVGTALQALRDSGVAASSIATGTHGVDVNFAVMSRPANASDLTMLDGLEASLVWLNLAGATLDDDAASTVGTYAELRRLHLEQSTITDAGVAHLSALEHLEYLNLYGTAVSDASLETIAALPALQQVYLWQSGVTDEGIAQLRALRPDLTVIAGDDLGGGAAAEEANAAIEEGDGESG